MMTGSDHEDKSHTLNLAEQEDRRCQDPFFFLSVWPHRVAHGISVPQIGIKPVPPTTTGLPGKSMPGSLMSS